MNSISFHLNLSLFIFSTFQNFNFDSYQLITVTVHTVIIIKDIGQKL
jgi:hypothetical protein